MEKEKFDKTDGTYLEPKITILLDGIKRIEEFDSNGVIQKGSLECPDGTYITALFNQGILICRTTTKENGDSITEKFDNEGSIKTIIDERHDGQKIKIIETKWEKGEMVERLEKLGF